VDVGGLKFLQGALDADRTREFHGSDAGGLPAPAAVVPSRPSHGMQAGGDDLGPVARNVGSIADNVGRCAAPVSANLGWNAR
jgi:hypothetical protein